MATDTTDTTDTDTSDSPIPGAPVGWFEIGTDDPESARRFYGGAFGWTFAQEQSYSVITTGQGHLLQGGIQDTTAPLPDGQPSSYAVPCVQVGDVAATCAKVEDLGGKVLVPATPIPSGLVYGFVTDPAGNRIGLFTPPPLT